MIGYILASKVRERHGNKERRGVRMVETLQSPSMFLLDERKNTSTGNMGGILK